MQKLLKGTGNICFCLGVIELFKGEWPQTQSLGYHSHSQGVLDQTHLRLCFREALFQNPGFFQMPFSLPLADFRVAKLNNLCSLLVF